MDPSRHLPDQAAAEDAAAYVGVNVQISHAACTNGLVRARVNPILDSQEDILGALAPTFVAWPLGYFAG